MPVKLEKRKVELDPSRIVSHLHNIRKKVILPQNDEIHQRLIQFIRNFRYEYITPKSDDLNSDQFISRNNITIGKQMFMSIPVINSSTLDENFPEEVRNAVSYFKTDLQIKLEEINAVNVSVYPPAQKSSAYVSKISRMDIKVAYRVIIFLCSDEFIKYKMLNMKGSSDLFGLNLPDNWEFPEYVERGTALCFNPLSGISLNISFNDESTCVIKRRERTHTRTKLPRSRYIVVIDFEYTPDALRQQLRENVKLLKGSINPNSSEKTQNPGQLTGAKPNKKISKALNYAENLMEQELKNRNEEIQKADQSVDQSVDEKTDQKTDESVNEKTDESVNEKIDCVNESVMKSLEDSF